MLQQFICAQLRLSIVSFLSFIMSYFIHCMVESSNLKRERASQFSLRRRRERNWPLQLQQKYCNVFLLYPAMTRTKGRKMPQISVAFLKYIASQLL